MANTIAIIYGRMLSSRLPGKVLKDLKGRTVFYHHLERMRQCKNVDKIYLATSKNTSNTPLIENARKCNIPYYAGSEEDIIERFITIGKIEKADIFVRCACDKPLFSYEIVDQLLNEYTDEDLLYVSSTVAKGVACELISMSALEKIHEHYRGPAISKYIHEYPHRFKIRGIEVDNEFSRPEFRLLLDEEEDYTLLNKIYDQFYTENEPINIKEVFKFLDDQPSLTNINRFVKSKESSDYLEDIKNTPILTIHQGNNGKYAAKNRMGENVGFDKLKDLLQHRRNWELGE